MNDDTAPMRALDKSARLVLLALRASDAHDLVSLGAATGLAKGTIISALSRLSASGLITADARGFHQAAHYSFRSASASGSVTADTQPQESKSPKVQKSKSPKVQFSARLNARTRASDDDDENEIASESSSSNQAPIELLDFRARVFALLGEWLIVGRKRAQLADAIANLPGTPDELIATMKRAHEGAKVRATKSPIGLTVHMLSEWAETGQLPLFELPTSQPALFDARQTLRGSGDDAPTPERLAASEAAAERYLAKNGRRGVKGLKPQVSYTEGQRAAARAAARQRLAEREGVTA